MLNRPFSIYCDWALHDEIGDNVELDEEMTLEVLDKLGYWRRKGITFDYYLFDAFWFDPHGDYKQFKTTHWPNGFQKAREKIESLGMKPGLWFDVNGFSAPRNKAWERSLTKDKRSYCLFDGPYASGFYEALVHAYKEWGVRIFKLDFANFMAITPELEGQISLDELYSKNTGALKKILKAFKNACPEAIILAYNGYELIPGYIANTSLPIKKGIDPSWLEVFDYLYSGDPRPADIPCISFRRAVDLYQDHMVYKFNYSGLPLYRIDDHGCMIGNTNTIYYLGKKSWRRSWVMTLARGSKKAHLYGNLHLLDDSDLEFLKTTKDMFFSFYKSGLETSTIGVPLQDPWHGFLLGGGTKGLLALVNSSSVPQLIELYLPGVRQAKPIFKDSGSNIDVDISLDTLSLILAPEQMVLMGLGDGEEFKELGEDEDEPVPAEEKNAGVVFHRASKSEFEGTWNPTEDQFLRVAVQVFEKDIALRLKAQKEGESGKEPAIQDYISISAYQENRVVPVHNWEPNRAVWSGCSWMNVLYNTKILDKNQPLTIKIKLNLDTPVTPQISCWVLNYEG